MDLAGAAEGRVWVVTDVEGHQPRLPHGARLVDQVPVGDGLTRSRILADARPEEKAEAIAPTLEDGYLWLVRGGSVA